MSGAQKSEIGDRMVKRFPLYLRVLREMADHGEIYASGAVVAKTLSLDPIVVRKDLSQTGVRGKPRLGFPLNEIITAIENYLGWDAPTEAVLAGAGRLGSALLGYPGFRDQGFKILAAFDVNPKRRTLIGGVPVYPASQMTETVRRLKVVLGILTVPADQAQGVADALVAGGVRGIWNFTPVQIAVPPEVTVKREDLAASLAVLSHRLRRGDKGR
ncbi:MAG TPA: redox-sensing transcriptional repressor Rex [Kiritimatiellia bacterium]|nr:redox-sensing transcriptional repressor Rex [Kiritimatiellia bacterium]HRU71283.1 redox-sensing transcriptional repressor Rex [Kiritimatiellia bacterium]